MTDANHRRRALDRHLGDDAVDPIVERTASPAPTVTIDRTCAPAVSIVIVTYGTGAVLLDGLGAIDAAARTPGAPPVEVIVVDHPHPQRPAATSTDLCVFTSGVRLVRARANHGFGGGCDVGVRIARAPVVAFVNPDVVVPPGWLEPLLDLLADDGIGIAAPVLLDPDGSVQEAGQTVADDGATRPVTELPGAPTEVDYASAACWVVRRDAYLDAGGFDPVFAPAYFEDVDLAFRMRSLGRRTVVHPDVRAVHIGGAGTPDLPRPAHANREVFRQRWLTG